MRRRLRFAHSTCEGFGFRDTPSTMYLLPGSKSSRVLLLTDGLVVLAAWLMFAALLVALAVVVLRGGGGHR